MADEPAKADECVFCDRVWAGVAILGALFVAVIALDTFTQGRVTEYLAGKFRPALALVVPIREAEGGDEPVAG